MIIHPNLVRDWRYVEKDDLGGVSNLEVMPQDPRRGGGSGICGC